jgi:sterile alpha motif and leucine zipper-containing kinase AZK
MMTDFISAKVGNFGTSRTTAQKGTSRKIYSTIGTPIFSAPELFRGEVCTEKVDVYSFGMLLIAMAANEPLLEFIEER